MIPPFLAEFKDALEAHKLQTVKIKATPVGEGETLLLTQSKFLGKPYLPVGFEYPKDAKGAPMILLAQINFAEIPPLEDYPTAGILQFFVSPTEWYNMDDYKVCFHATVEAEAQTDFSFLTEELYAESPVFREHKLAFEKITEYGGTEDFRFQMDFNGKDYYEFQEGLTKAQEARIEELLSGTGHKIGGYAYFTQSDPRGYGKHEREDLLLLQIDTDEDIMFGDSGVGNFFISLEDLRKKDFDKAWFHWDCC